MSEPKLTILGVYRPQISAETWHAQWLVSADDEETEDHFAGLVLMEGIVEDPQKPFDMGSFGQMQREFPNDVSRMMVGYDEGLLSPDGETLIERSADCLQGTGPIRFAVYLHLYDPDRPVQWQGGQVACPAPQDVPVRLMMLMPYNACS